MASYGKQYGSTYGVRELVRQIEAAPMFDDGGKLTLRQLTTQFRDIFRRSEYSKLQVLGATTSGEKYLSMNIRSEVKSAVGPWNYQTWIVLRRRDLNNPFTMDSPAEIRCTCPAFHYFVAYADWTRKNLAGRPSSWNKVAAPIRNPRTIPSPCKHLVALTFHAIRKGII